MLNIGKIRAQSMTYHLDAVADGVEDYYFSAHEAPGTWVGSSSSDLGVEGQVTRDQLVRLLCGRHPTTDAPLTTAGPAGRVGNRLPGYDVTLRAPKSVSLLWALTADDGVRAEVQAGHDAAVVGALRYLEGVAAIARRGRGGSVQIPTTGLAAAAFRHRTSRAGDPVVHTHLVVPNVVLGVDGRWSALHGAPLYANGKSAGYVYQALLRGELTRRLGVVWGPVRSGCADLGGTPADVIRAFSRRREEIEQRRDDVAARRAAQDAAAAARGTATLVSPAEIGLEKASQLQTSGATSQLAALETRHAKDHSVVMPTTVAEWRDRADQLGYTEGARRTQLARQDPPAVSREVEERLAARLAGMPAGGPLGGNADHLAGRGSTFSRRDAVMGWCGQLAQGAESLDQISTLTDRFLATHPGVLRVDGQPGLRKGDGIRLATGEFIPARSDLVRYTTWPMRLAETSLVDSAARRRTVRVGIARPSAVDAAVRRFGGLTGSPLTTGQEAAVRRVTGSGAGVDIVVGHPGTGKTTALRVARDAWESSGIPVAGAAKSAAAARTLELETGIPSRTLDSLLLRVASEPDRAPLPPGGVLVVDEAAMTETRTMSKLVTVAERRHWKTVLVGDDHQLREIDAGGAFRGLRERLGAVVLDENLRQREPWERDALDLVRRGAGVDALSAYIDHDRVTVASSRDEALELMVDRWWNRRGDGGSELLQARRNVDVTELNRRVHARRVATGEVAQDGVRNGAGVDIGVGDRVLTRVTSRPDGVINGLRGVVVAISDDSSNSAAGGPSPALSIDVDGGDVVRLRSGYFGRLNAEALPAVDLAYATTIHRNQGATAERAQVLVDAGLSADALYVALSRGRSSNDIVVIAAGADYSEGAGHWAETPAPRRALETTVRVIEASAAKRLSTDEPSVDPYCPVASPTSALAVDQLVAAWRASADRLAGKPTSRSARSSEPWESPPLSTSDPHLTAIEQLLHRSRVDPIEAAAEYIAWRRLNTDADTLARTPAPTGAGASSSNNGSSPPPATDDAGSPVHVRVEGGPIRGTNSGASGSYASMGPPAARAR